MNVLEKIKWHIQHPDAFGKKLLSRKLSKWFMGKSGIEIGGTTFLFTSTLPIYEMVKSLDGCNYSNNTVWEGKIKEGQNYTYHGDKKGFQYIAEASDLKDIATESYDFLIASHCLEHCANALKTMQEWVRLLKPNGVILLVLPDKRYTFDHKRNITLFEHLLDDYNLSTDEKDLYHLEEILALHDLEQDPLAGDIEQFKARSILNYENRCLHHHVFNFELLSELCKYFKLKIKFKTLVKPYHQIIIAQKSKV